jgi:hypothetical protein
MRWSVKQPAEENKTVITITQEIIHDDEDDASILRRNGSVTASKVLLAAPPADTSLNIFSQAATIP